MKNRTPLNVSAQTQDRKHWHVIVETPRGSRNKFAFEPDFNAYCLTEILPEGLSFPYDFGFIPSTLGEDGDPIDVLLLMDDPSFSGCLVPARLIGVVEGEQKERDKTQERNDRLVAVPIKTCRYARIHSLKDIDKKLRNEIGKFFVTYNQELGKKFKVLATRGPNRAKTLARKGMKAFAKRHPKRSMTRPTK